MQPGLLLKGVSQIYDESNVPYGHPRRSWLVRAWQQREAVAEGLAEWQVRALGTGFDCCSGGVLSSFLGAASCHLGA